jgi:hypothetical protein
MTVTLDTGMAVISTATAGVSDNPARRAASRPLAAPVNDAGNAGPPWAPPGRATRTSATGDG